MIHILTRRNESMYMISNTEKFNWLHMFLTSSILDNSPGSLIGEILTAHIAMKHLNEIFIKYLLLNYQNYCVGQRKVPGMHNFVEYLLSHNLLAEDTVRHYVILQEYEQKRKEEAYPTKTQTVNALADFYGLHPNSVWNILKDHKEKFNPNP